jgi:hypothetical protein
MMVTILGTKLNGTTVMMMGRTTGLADETTIDDTVSNLTTSTLYGN